MAEQECQAAALGKRLNHQVLDRSPEAIPVASPAEWPEAAQGAVHLNHP